MKKNWLTIVLLLGFVFFLVNAIRFDLMQRNFRDQNEILSKQLAADNAWYDCMVASQEYVNSCRAVVLVANSDLMADFEVALKDYYAFWNQDLLYRQDNHDSFCNALDVLDGRFHEGLKSLTLEGRWSTRIARTEHQRMEYLSLYAKYRDLCTAYNRARNAHFDQAMDLATLPMAYR